MPDTSKANNAVIDRDRRGFVTRGQFMGYFITLGPIEYVGTRDGQPFSLASAIEAIRGVGCATVRRPDGTVVVRHGL